MSDSIEKFNQALKKLEELVVKKAASGDAAIIEESLKLKAQLAITEKKYEELLTTSEDVINQLNNSIQVIDNFFKKQDANNKNS